MPITADQMVESILRPHEQALDEVGFTIGEFAKLLWELRNAKETKFFAYQGRVFEEREVEALGIRVEAARIYMGTRGLQVPSETKVEHSGAVTIHTHYISSDPVKKPSQTDVAVQTRGPCQEDEA